MGCLLEMDGSGSHKEDVISIFSSLCVQVLEATEDTQVCTSCTQDYTNMLFPSCTPEGMTVCSKHYSGTIEDTQVCTFHAKHCSSHAMTEDTGAMTENTGATAHLSCSSHAMTDNKGATGCEDGMLDLMCDKYKVSLLFRSDRGYTSNDRGYRSDHLFGLLLFCDNRGYGSDGL